MSIPFRQAIRETVIASINEARAFIVAQCGPENHQIEVGGRIVRQLDESAALLQSLDALPPAAVHVATFMGRLNMATASRLGAGQSTWRPRRANPTFSCSRSRCADPARP
jgi:hypothetical protein